MQEVRNNLGKPSQAVREAGWETPHQDVVPFPFPRLCLNTFGFLLRHNPEDTFTGIEMVDIAASV